MAVGVGQKVEIDQIQPSNLNLESQPSLPIKDDPGFPGNHFEPVLTATANGPLWVAGGEDVWALNSATGQVELEFDAGNDVSSMSTDSSGQYLYTGGTTGSGMVVTQYDSDTGKELQRSDNEQYLAAAVTAGSVVATAGGVWVSVRYGMAGAAFELSALSLTEIAPHPQSGFGTETKCRPWFGTASQLLNKSAIR